MKVIDERYGKNGGGIWALPSGILIFSLISILLVYVLLTEDFSNTGDVLLVLIIAVITSVVFLLNFCHLTFEAFHVVQSANCKENQVTIRLYFGRVVHFKSKEISSINKFSPRKWIKLPTLLSHRGENFVISLNNGDRLFLAGFLPNSREFILGIEQ